MEANTLFRVRKFNVFAVVHLLIWMTLSVVLWVCNCNYANAGEASINGYLQQRSEYALSESKGYTASEFLARIDTKYKHSDILSLFSSLRGRYDAIYDTREDNPGFKAALATNNDMRSESQVRELFLDYAPMESLRFRFGKQIVSWGEADGLRLMDVINPLDNKFGGPTRDFEERAKPLTMVRIDYDMPNLQEYGTSVEFIWVPGDFEKAELAPTGAPWAPTTPVFIGGLIRQQVLRGFRPVSAEFEKPQQVKYSRYGAKLTSKVGDVDFTLNYFHTYADSAVNFARFTIDNTFYLDKRYPIQNILGATFNWDTGLTVIRGEVTYELKHNFQDITTQDWTVEKDYLKSMVGFDHYLVFRGFNNARSIFISGQLFNYHIVGYNNNIINLPYGYRVKKDESIFTLLVNTGFFSDTVKPELFAAYDASYDVFWLRPKVKLEFGSDWRLELGANWFKGRDDLPRIPLGVFDHDSAAYAQLQRMF